ncbi:hypothetical protein [Kitasatospora sp. MAP5-34]|uniref:hypothetical protein n=1 Tax=Kitasatospora sp. MAP5-34 TaxID=3035102 RepID=UPI0024737F43|nr:hypothetical protein [Kitasatospora sp. MAP5-34]MDH6575506.1 hypothetical protein [Kitasatospora sp. MAP5-34]
MARSAENGPDGSGYDGQHGPDRNDGHAGYDDCYEYDDYDEYEAPRRRRPLRKVMIGLLMLAVVAAVVLFVNRKQLITPDEGCKVTTATGQGSLDLSQASNAATITAVALSRGLPERAATIALATAMQESKLRNLAGGDRDSVGLFQQRPSQGWGTAAQIQDPVYATNKFLDSLVRVPGYARLPLTDAAQAVQKSGYPQAYAKHETDATLLASVFTGRAPAALDCVVHQLAAAPAAATPAAADAASSASPDPSGSPEPQGVADRVRREFGRTATTAPAAKADKDPRTVLAVTPQAGEGTDPGPDAQRQGGWAVAQWAVAHAQELGIGVVAYDGKVWSFDKPTSGWQAKAPAASTDHVLLTLGAPAKH